MLAVVLLIQHQVSSSQTIRTSAPCGVRCMGHAVSTWSAVCSEAPHLQLGEGSRSHLCMDEWNCPTPLFGNWSKNLIIMSAVGRFEPFDKGGLSQFKLFKKLYSGNNFKKMENIELKLRLC